MIVGSIIVIWSGGTMGYGIGGPIGAGFYGLAATGAVAYIWLEIRD